jgi:hypothetical protein
MTHPQLRVAWFDLFLLSQWKVQVSSEFAKGLENAHNQQHHILVAWARCLASQ